MCILEFLSMNMLFSVYILTEMQLREVAVLLEQAQQPLAALHTCPSGPAPHRELVREHGEPHQPRSILVGKKLAPILMPKARQ